MTADSRIFYASEHVRAVAPDLETPNARNSHDHIPQLFEDELTSERPGYVPGVDALRAFAVLLVVAVHTRVVAVGWAGVWIFFVVSGFAITTSLQGPIRRRGKSQALQNFYVRRCLRIWPLYFGFVLGNVAVMSWLGRLGPLRSIPYLVSFTYNFEMIFASNSAQINWPPFAVLWTLSVEEQFYVVYPVLFLLASRRTTIIVLLTFVACAPLARVVIGYSTLQAGWADRDAYFAVYAFGPAHFDAFAGGALIAMFRTQISTAHREVRLFSGAVAGAAVVYFSTYAMLQYLQAGHLSKNVLRNIVTGVTIGQGREAFLYTFAWLTSASLLMLLLSGQKTLTVLCRLPGTQAIGRISYGIYIFHGVVLILLGALVSDFTDIGPARLITRLIDFGLVSVISYFVALLSFRYFERPFLRLRKHYS